MAYAHLSARVNACMCAHHMGAYQTARNQKPLRYSSYCLRFIHAFQNIGVVCDARTARAASNIAFDEVGRVKVKGKAKKVLVFR